MKFVTQKRYRQTLGCIVSLLQAATRTEIGLPAACGTAIAFLALLPIAPLAVLHIWKENKFLPHLFSYFSLFKYSDALQIYNLSSNSATQWLAFHHTRLEVSAACRSTPLICLAVPDGFVQGEVFQCCC